MPTDMESLAQFKQRILDLQTLVLQRKKLKFAKKLKISEIEGATTALDEDIVLYVYADILARLENHEFDDLQAGDAIYIPRPKPAKNKPGDPARSYSLIYSPDGSFMVFIEPKSKLPDNTIRYILYIRGSFKVCKGGYRADIWPYTPCVALVATLAANDPELDTKIAAHVNEIAINNTMAEIEPRFFSHAESFVEHERDGKVKIHTYMDHADYNLHFLIQSSIDDPGTQLNLNRTEIKFGDTKVLAYKLDIMHQLLQAVHAMHSASQDPAKRFVHRDIKPENILCVYDKKSKKFAIKIIDFGIAVQAGKYAMRLAGTANYMPPEAYLAFAINTQGEEKYGIDDVRNSLNFLRKYDVNYMHSLGLDAAISTLDNATKLEPNILNSKQYITGQHDMYSLGVTFAQILGWDKNQINTGTSDLHKFVRGLLNPNPELRYTSAQALNKFQELLQSISNTNMLSYFNTKATPERAPIKFTDVPILSNALKKFNVVFDKPVFNKSKYNEATNVLLSYFANLATGSLQADPEDQKVFDQIKIFLKNIYDIASNQYDGNKVKKLIGLIATIEPWLNEIANEDITRFDPRFHKKEQAIAEDDWIKRKERTLGIMLVLNIAKMALAQEQQDKTALQTIKQDLFSDAKSQAENIESHKRMPFGYKFSKR